MRSEAEQSERPSSVSPSLPCRGLSATLPFYRPMCSWARSIAATGARAPSAVFARRRHEPVKGGDGAEENREGAERLHPLVIHPLRRRPAPQGHRSWPAPTRRSPSPTRSGRSPPIDNRPPPVYAYDRRRRDHSWPRRAPRTASTPASTRGRRHRRHSSRGVRRGGGTFTYGSYPDSERADPRAGGENDPKKREAILHRIQQMIHERVVFAPIWELGLPQRTRAPGRGVRPHADHRAPVLLALRGPGAEAQVDEARGEARRRLGQQVGDAHAVAWGREG